MTHPKPNTEDEGMAAKMVRALEMAGIKSHVPNPTPKPDFLAFQAFLICDLGKKAEWDELIARLTGPGVPRAAYYRKMAELCLRALRRPHMPEELVEHMTFSWGYFNGRLESEIERFSKPDAAA